jgi:hypothetical protein
MKKLALGALFAGLAAACSDGGGGIKLIDAGAADAAPVVCNPIAGTGCAAGEKCTWIIDLDATSTTDAVGHVGCAVAGGIPDGGACDDATAISPGGTDGCIAGDLCIAGKCKPICDPQLVPGSAAGACRTDFACTSYRGVFETGTAAAAGVCEPGCDPLTQSLKIAPQTGTAGACGSSDPAQPDFTCVPADAFKSFACAPSGSRVYANTDRVAPLGDSRGFFANGCAPGFIPFYFEDASGSQKTLCSGLCAPLDVDMTIATEHADNPDYNAGDPTVLGKLVTDPAPVAGHATCIGGIKGKSGAAKTEDCRYVWQSLATQGLPSMAADSPYNDTLGVCFEFGSFKTVDLDGDKVPDAFEKSCSELPAVAPAADDPYGSAADNGCYSLARTLAMPVTTTLRKTPHRLGQFRAAYGTGSAVRHVFD